MFGVIMSILAGAAMSFQGVINTRLSDKIGLYESNAFVQGTAFLLGLLACFFLGKGNFSAIREVNWVYWTGGVLGLVITITVMLSIGQLSPTYAISIILISQLLVAAGVMKTWAVLAYLPYLVIAGAGAGLFTGLCAQFLMQRLDRLASGRKEENHGAKGH